MADSKARGHTELQGGLQAGAVRLVIDEAIGRRGVSRISADGVFAGNGSSRPSVHEVQDRPDHARPGFARC